MVFFYLKKISGVPEGGTLAVERSWMGIYLQLLQAGGGASHRQPQEMGWFQNNTRLRYFHGYLGIRQ